MANYHPSDELLMQFSAGQVPNALGLIIACHLEKCSQCRAKTRLYERVGGDLVSGLSPVSVSDNLLDDILLKIDSPVSEHENHPKPATINHVPKPLQRFVDRNLQDLEWTGMSKDIKEYRLPFSDQQYAAKLYKISAGKELPEHTHKGHEFTLVMEGGFSDKAGDYNVGDFILADTQTIHQPKAYADEDCICFAVLDAPLKMTGFFGRLLNPFLS